MSEEDVQRALAASDNRTKFEPNAWQRFLYKHFGYYSRSPLEMLMDKWWYPRATRKRMRDPEYRRLEERLRRPDGLKAFRDYDGDEEKDTFFNQIELGHKIAPHPWWWKFHHWLRDHGVRAQKRHIKSIWQRGTRGYADHDMWNLDSWFTQVIGGGVAAFRDYPPHGWPGEPMTYEDYIRVLDEIVEGFNAARRIQNSDYDHNPKDQSEYDQLKAKFDHALDLLKEHYFSLWD